MRWSGDAQIEDSGHVPVIVRDQPAEVRQKARLFVAGVARDVEDCRMLLDMLGLLPDTKERT